jgi:hypothetical protein
VFIEGLGFAGEGHAVSGRCWSIVSCSDATAWPHPVSTSSSGRRPGGAFQKGSALQCNCIARR